MARWIGFIWIFFFPLLLKGDDLPRQNQGDAAFLFDEAELFSMHEKELLIQKLVNYNDTSSNEFAIVIENSLLGVPLEERSIAIANEWGVGRKDKDNGVLIYIAVKERAIRIDVGQGLEGRITDGEAERVIRKVMEPQFKKGRFYDGVDQALNKLIELASGENQGFGKELVPHIWIIIAIIIIVIILLIIFSKGGHTYTGRRHTLPSPWWGGFGGGGSGGFGGSSGGFGGFGGFGGGSFGGGGASGGW